MGNGSLLAAALGAIVVAAPAGAMELVDPQEVPQAWIGQGWPTDFSRATVDFGEILSVLGPDNIPAIDDPEFAPVTADAIPGNEPVIALEIAGDARAYPIRILMWHEIVNDIAGGIPVSVTFCPLCNTAIAFDRRLDGRVLDFGTTGRLRHSDLVMYDRQTETWWQQATGEGIVGQYAGRMLEFISAPLISWKTFRATFPDGQVLSRRTGFRRDYGSNPYVRYDQRPSPMARFFDTRPDGRLPAMERVVAVELNGESVAYPFSSLRARRAVNDRIGGTRVVVLWAPGTASALDSRRIADGRDVGSSNVFHRVLDGRILTFDSDRNGAFNDRETGSTWDIMGRAVAGRLAGKRLEPIVHGNHFWFAWGVFRPETRVER